MSTIHYLTGDATAPQAAGNKIIVHVCNDIGGWGAGFVVAISKKWPEPEKAFRQWYKERDTNNFALGAVELVQVEDDCWVANVIGQRDIKRKAGPTGEPPIRYAAIEEGLHTVAAEAQALSASVHMPRIGCGLAGGTWDKIEPLIEQSLIPHGIEVFVYDFV